MFGKKNIAKSIRKGNLDEVKQILAEKPELLEQKFSTWKSTDSLLYIAAVYNQLDIVKYLVTEMGMDVDVRNEMNATPLHCTVEAGEFEATSLLLDLGADPLAEWKYGDVKSLAQQRSQKFRDLIDAACDKKLELEKAAAVEKEILEHEKRVEGIWTSATTPEVTYEHQAPGNKYLLTDIFNFTTNTWTSILENPENGQISHDVKSLDEAPEELVNLARAHLNGDSAPAAEPSAEDMAEENSPAQTATAADSKPKIKFGR